MTVDGTSRTQCRALVAGFGRPGMRDLDFGRQVVDYLRQLDWPQEVVVEDLSCAAPLVLHRLQELRPAKVVLLGAVPRGLDAPATLRRYRPDAAPAGPADVHRSLEGSAMGLVDLDHTLVVARHWGGLPVDTVVIEVEPAETCFGLGFSEELGGCFDAIVEMVREELGDVADGVGLHPDFGPDDLSTSLTEGPASPNDDTGPGQPSQAVTELVGYARHHAEARLESGRARPVVERMPFDVPGVALAGRVRPWGVFVESGGDWFDALPLDGGRLGIVVGNVAGRGVEVAATMSDLKMAARAYVVLDGGSPARVVSNLDRLAEATGLGDQARLLVLALDPATGEVRFSNAGGCPPLVVDGGASTGRFVEAARAAPLGGARHCARTEATLQLATGSTLLLFTDGLVESAAVSRATGLERLRQAATGGPAALDALCDHVLNVCTRRLRRDDDICVLGARLLSDHALAEGPSDRSGP